MEPVNFVTIRKEIYNPCMLCLIRVLGFNAFFINFSFKNTEYVLSPLGNFYR